MEKNQKKIKICGNLFSIFWRLNFQNSGTMTKNWRVVTKEHPCEICGKDHYCRVFDDGGIQCMRVPGGIPCKSGGWMYKDEVKSVPVFHHIGRPTPPPSIDAEAIWRKWHEATGGAQLDGLAKELGVEPEALEMIGAAWAEDRDAWAFPMKSGAGKIVGIRLRNSTGRKWAVCGSKQGLFVPDIQPTGKLAVIAEGPTDTAALLSIGMFAIGRPCCQGCMEEVRETLKRLNIYKVIIMADNDDPKVRPDGTTWQPGQEGALQLQDFLKFPSLLIVPPVKDIRDWIKDGCTAEMIEGITSQRVWKYVCRCSAL